MLVYKFYLSTTGRILKDTPKLFPRLHYVKFIGNSISSNESDKSKDNIKYRSIQLEKYKKNVNSLLLCPKKTLLQFNCRKLNYSDKGDTEIIASKYVEVQENVKKHIEYINNFVKKEKLTIVESLRKEANVDKTDTYRWMKNISGNVDERLQQLVQLDPCFASETRITVLRFKDRARNAFVGLYRDLMPSVKRIESILDKLETETSRFAEKAANLTLFSPNDDSSLKKCFLKNTEEAEEILERTMREIEIKLDEVKRLRNDVLKCHKEAMTETTNEHSSEMQALVRCLDDCIASLKELNEHTTK